MGSNSEVLVIGAGLAGLNGAIQLEAAGVDVTVIEASDRAGGRVASDVIDGFICDRGFQLINSKYPALQELDVIKEIDFITAPRVIEVALGNDRHALGDPRVAPWTAIDRATGTIPEKLALIRFLASKPPSNFSVEDSLKSLGSTYDRVLRPFLHGVFLTDPKNVDARYGQSIVKSFVTGSPGLPRKGVAALSNALAVRVKNISYRTQVDTVENGTVHTSAGTFTAKKVVIATDADVDGMHIRLLLITFFLQFFPELVREGHLYILQTPLFRVRNKKETRYCYTPEEKNSAIDQLGPRPEITRFKGLGEISPDEFKHFIDKCLGRDFSCF